MGIILQEIPQGFKHEGTFSKVMTYFDAFPLLTVSRTDYIAAANLRRQAAAEGLTLSTSNCQIAAVALQYHCHLLTIDKDFSNLT